MRLGARNAVYVRRCATFAINDFKVDTIFCESCGFCFHACFAEAIMTRENLSGHWYISETKYGHLVHARLGIAQGNSGKLVALVRGLPVVEYSRGKVTQEIGGLWQTVTRVLGG